jgi:hypothetical protein
MHSAASGVLPRRKPRATAGPAFQRCRARLLPADPADPPSVINSARTNEGLGSDAPSPFEWSRAREAPTPSQTTKIVCTTDPLKISGFPIRDAFQPVGEPLAGPRLIPSAVKREVQRPTSLHPSRVTASASPAYPTSSRNRKWLRRTDAAYRLLQPSESMSTPRERLLLAQNPLFRRILLVRKACVRTCERHGSRS